MHKLKLRCMNRKQVSFVLRISIRENAINSKEPVRNCVWVFLCSSSAVDSSNVLDGVRTIKLHIHFTLRSKLCLSHIDNKNRNVSDCTRAKNDIYSLPHWPCGFIVRLSPFFPLLQITIKQPCITVITYRCLFRCCFCSSLLRY